MRSLGGAQGKDAPWPISRELESKWARRGAREHNFGLARLRLISSPLAARSWAAPPIEAAAHGIGNVTPSGGSNPFAWQTVLVDGVEEREPIRYRDPGVAHADVEIALVLLVSLLRKLCALGSHPPRVVGLGSHHTPCVPDDLSVDHMPLPRGVCPISDSRRAIFVLALCVRAATVWNEIALCGLPIELEFNHAALLFPSQLRSTHRAGRGRRGTVEPNCRAR
jgi:hypothetical protein